MLTPAAPASTGSRMAATARRYDAALSSTSTPPSRRVAAAPADEAPLDPAGYSANAAMSLTAEAARGTLIDLLA
jgi:hypothetical protein